MHEDQIKSLERRVDREWDRATEPRASDFDRHYHGCQYRMLAGKLDAAYDRRRAA